MRLANEIERSDGPLHLLFAGHRGGGKSTELLRLEHRLSQPPAEGEGFFIVYFEADKEDVDVNDVDFPDLLLAVIRQVGKALRERAGVELRPARLSRFVDDFKQLLGSEVQFERLELDAKIARFTAAIKSSPNVRRDIRKALEPGVSNLIQAANDLLDEASTRLKARGFRDLVLIADNLDRIVLRDIPDSPFNTHEQLFINRGAQLAELRSCRRRRRPADTGRRRTRDSHRSGPGCRCGGWRRCGYPRRRACPRRRAEQRPRV
jgi:hypothetical protein